MNNNYFLVVRLGNMKERVRASKILKFLDKQNTVTLVKKASSEDIDLKIQYVNLIHEHNSKLIEYFLWVTKLFFKSLLFPKSSKTWVIGFESALPVYLASLFRNIEYIYDNADNFYQSVQMTPIIKRIVLSLDRRIIKKSITTVIPNSIRAVGYNLPDEKFSILKNFPSEEEYREALVIRDSSIKNKLVIYINGLLTPVRGLKMIEEFISKLESGVNIEIKVAGKDKHLSKILESEHVKYLGEVDSITSLAHYWSSDLIFTFYDPTLEINKIATPNKWGDCLVTSTVPILNSEIRTIKDYFPNKGYIAVNYGDSHSLYEEVMNVYKNPNILKQKKAALELNPTFFWETQLEVILKNT